jgi:glutaminase
MAAEEPKLKLALLERLASGAYEQLDVMLRSLLRQSDSM